MKKAKKQLSKTILPPLRSEWLDDPDVILFVRDREPGPVTGPSPLGLAEPSPYREIRIPVAEGMERHSLVEWASSVFGRAKKEVRQDWEKALSQMHFLLEGVSAATKDYELAELTFNLGFSGEGRIAFITKAGLTTSISAKFTRKPPGASQAH
jgi:hypothetical protein